MVPRSEFERELQVLQTELKRLEADYNMFFAGRLPKLPWDQRARVEAMMKRFDRMHIQNTGDRFRFQTIQSRWAAFGELWERQMKAQEMGRRPGQRAAAMPPSPVAPPRPAPPREGTIAEARVSDPSVQADRVQSLYEQLAEARRAVGSDPIDYNRFSELVKAQVKKLGTDGREVAFSVAVKDGKVTLSAKPVKED
jgi:hypothetical protein